MERDEWVGAAWRVTVVKEIDPQRLMFVDEELTSPFTRCTLGPKEDREPGARYPVTAARTPPCSPA
jgi:hypothetical protein